MPRTLSDLSPEELQERAAKQLKRENAAEQRREKQEDAIAEAISRLSTGDSSDPAQFAKDLLVAGLGKGGVKRIKSLLALVAAKKTS